MWPTRVVVRTNGILFQLRLLVSVEESVVQKNVPLREMAEFLVNWFKKPITLFDCETTGNDPKLDRVVQIALLRLPELVSFETLVNPGFPIAPEVSEVHGITTEIVKDSPSFFEISPQLYQLLHEQDSLLCGYNIRTFDMKILTEEFKRVQLSFPKEGAPVIDSCELFYKMEPRDLSGAMKHYLNDTHELAHGAMPDVIATVKVLYAQLHRYEGLPTDPAEFSNLTKRQKRANYLDESGRVIWWFREATLSFGKHKGTTLRDVYRKDRGYFSWVLREDFPQDMKDIIAEAYQGRFPEYPEVIETVMDISERDPIDTLF